MVRHGDVIDVARYCSAQRLGGRIVPDVADPRKVADEISGGATLVLQSLQRHWAPLVQFCDELMLQLGHPVQANAYLTPPDGTGLRTHADEHDVFAVQLHGTKCWQVDGLGDFVMRPGDVLYVPAGCRHAARSELDVSLHLTIGVLRVTYRHVLERVLSPHLEQLDRPLPLGYRSDSLTQRRFEAELRDALEAVATRLLGADPSGVAAAECQRVLAPYSRAGHLSSVLGLDRIGPDTTVSWVTTAPRFEPLDDADGRAWLRLKLADRALRLPAVAQGAIEHLATHRHAHVGDLPGIDPPSRLALVRRLVREGACIVQVHAADS